MVAEKPSVAKSVATVMSAPGGFRSRASHSPYNYYFEFEARVQGVMSHVVFTSVTGHLYELDFTAEYRRNWAGSDPLELFDAPVVRFIPDSKAALKRNLEEEAKLAHTLVLWLDCDREGENICFE